MKKKLFSVVLSAAMITASLTGCGGKEAADTPAPADAPASAPAADNSAKTDAPAVPETQATAQTPAASDGEPVTLTVLAGQSTTDAGIEDMIDEALAEAYPNITLEWECVDWGNDFQPKMQQYMQSGLPDIMIGKAQDVATYAPQGILGKLMRHILTGDWMPRGQM